MSPPADLPHLLQGDLANTPLPIFKWTRADADAPLRLAAFNAEALRWTGGNVSRLLGQTAEALYAREPAILAEMYDSLATGQVARRVMAYALRTTGEARQLAVTYAPSGPHTLLVYTVDLTSEHRAADIQTRVEGLDEALLEALGALIGLGLAELGQGLPRLLRALGQGLRLNACALAEVSAAGDHLQLRHEWTAAGISPTPEGFDLKQFGVIRTVLEAGRPWIWHRGEALPAAAQALDRVFLGAPVIRAAAIIPFDVAGRPRHALMLHQGEDPHGLRGEVAQRLLLLTRMLGDLLSRARHDAERQALARRLESVVAQTPTCLWLVDADGRPQHLNRAAQRLLGLTPQTMGQALAAFELSTLAAAAGFPPGMDLLGGDAAQLAVEAPLARLQEALGLPPDGGEGRIVSTRFLCIEQPDGSREGALRFEEITAQRQLEARIRRAQKLEAIGELAGGLAHEFNNELGVIQLGLGQALQALRQGRPVDAQDLESALAAARRSGDTTRHLLGFSRRAELRPRVVDLGRLVARFESTLRRWLPERIVLAVHPVAALADVDPGLIEQALLNLLSNARDAIEGPGRIDIAVGVDGAQVHLAVRDDGPGMPAEVQARAFEPFFTTKPVGRGTGLGLAMVYGTVQQLGGEVEIESAPGAGTCVWLRFPRAVAPSPRGPTAPSGGAEPSAG